MIHENLSICSATPLTEHSTPSAPPRLPLATSNANSRPTELALLQPLQLPRRLQLSSPRHPSPAASVTPPRPLPPTLPARSPRRLPNRLPRTTRSSATSASRRRRSTISMLSLMSSSRRLLATLLLEETSFLVLRELASWSARRYGTGMVYFHTYS